MTADETREEIVPCDCTDCTTPQICRHCAQPVTPPLIYHHGGIVCATCWDDCTRPETSREPVAG